MIPSDPQRSPLGLAIASGAVLSGVLELLVEKQILTIPEVRGVLSDALKIIGPRTQQPGGFDASQTIQELMRHFAERPV